MELTRRKVLTLGALTAASAAVPLSAFAGIMGAGAPATTAGDNEYDNLARLTVADFKPWVGSVFDVATGESQSTLLILDEVQDPPSFPKLRRRLAREKTRRLPLQPTLRK